ncbi:MAG: hypothetical protein EOO68_23970 [Moraxellaceae bacterium]|nr:MAG: hypothetical protein EOO68_23970 [Moraxellaceae bacterium]
MAVRGSFQHSMRVIPYRPYARLLAYVVVASIFIVSLPIAYFVGVYVTRHSQEQNELTINQKQEQAVRELSQELTRLRIDAEVNQQTVEELRQMAMTQKAQLSSAERDLQVYKELLSPGAKTNPLGISFGALTVFPSAEAHLFTYKLIVQKLSTKDTSFSGNLVFRVLGEQAGKPAQFSLDQISSQVTSPSIPLNLKYFQTIEGDMRLPEDFIPRKVELIVEPEDRKSPSIIETQLEWPISST